MRRGYYQALLFCFLILSPLVEVSDFLVVQHNAHGPQNTVLLIGLFLQPISAIGLWHDRIWGIVFLLVAMILCVFTVFGGAIGPLIVFALTAIRFVTVKKGQGKAASSEGTLGPSQEEADR